MTSCRKKLIRIVSAMSVLFVLTACGGGGGGDEDSQESSIISGRVIDDAGQGLANAIVSTVPPSERRLTDADGFFQISDGVFAGEVYDVTAQQIGFDPSTQRVSVEQGGVTNSDFRLLPAVNGLASSASNIQLTGTETRTFLLTSTIDNTPVSYTHLTLPTKA